MLLSDDAARNVLRKAVGGVPEQAFTALRCTGTYFGCPGTRSWRRVGTPRSAGTSSKASTLTR
jgi:hypothetical protein